jgi:hypothetical protein
VGPYQERQVASVVRLQEKIAVMMRSGASLNRVEDEVIDHSRLNSNQKAALWLYAWSFMDGTTQRHEATSYLLNVEPG